MAEAPPPARCPTCRGPVSAAAEQRPFCGDRCRLLDLGRWAREDYRVSRPLRPEEIPEEADGGGDGAP